MRASAQSTLADVTAILAELLRVNVDRLRGANDTDVTFVPPEKADDIGGTHLNLYLYLAAHDADGGPNLPMGTGRNPIERVALPLKLYYVMTAHAFDLDDEVDVAGQQFLMGLGMKTFHDHPLVRDDSTIGTTPVVPAGSSLGGGRIEVSLRPISPEESVNFWSTDQVRTARLAAYYEVRTVLIPPEDPPSDGGPVADVALGVFAGGPPRLISSSSQQSFEQPAPLGGATMSFERAPAVAMLRAAPGDDAVVTVTGLALGDGTGIALILRSDSLPGGSAVLEPDSNVAWAIFVTDDSLTFTVQPTAHERDAGPIDILPGIYSVGVLKQRELTNEDGSVSTFTEVESNRLPFAVAPTIDEVNVLANDNVEVVTQGGFATELPQAQSELTIGSVRFRQVADNGLADPVDPDTFSEPASDRYLAMPQTPLAPGTYPVRLTVNGAESQPFWVEVGP